MSVEALHPRPFLSSWRSSAKKHPLRVFTSILTECRFPPTGSDLSPVSTRTVGRSGGVAVRVPLHTQAVQVLPSSLVGSLRNARKNKSRTQRLSFSQCSGCARHGESTAVKKSTVECRSRAYHQHSDGRGSAKTDSSAVHASMRTAAGGDACYALFPSVPWHR